MVHLGGAAVLLLLSLISSTEPMEKCPENADLSFLENLTPAPGKSIDTSAGSLEPLYNFARLFIEAVQPNNFPLELAINASRNVPLNISLLVEYEAGYLVCLILAILYVLIMPVVGGVLAWNHLHLKKRSPNKTSTASSICPHMVIILETCLAVVVILLLTGVILAFTTNNKVRENMKPSLEQLSTDIKKVDDILKLIPKNTRAVINGFSIPKREITKELNETGNVIGETLISSFDRSVREALSALALSVQDASGALTNLEKMEMKRKDLQARHRVIQLRLQAIQSELQRIQTGCPDCNVSDASNLETVADFHQIPSVQPQLDQLNGFSSILATNIVREGNLSFYSIPQICSNQLEPTITELVLDLEESEEYLRNSSGRIPTLRSLSNSVSSLRLAVQQYRRDVDYYDYVRWAVAVVFCMLILVIVILMVVALCLGLPIEYFPSLYSSLTKDRFKHTAVYLLRSAVVMTFFFSWLFLILVFITLLIGGNAHTLGCRSWKSGALFELLDQWEDLFLVGPGYNTTYGINSTHTTNFSQELNSTQNIKVKFQAAEVYHGCMRGESLFYSMHMHEVLNMDAFLNASKYLGVFNQSFQTLSVNLDGVTLLQPDGRQALLKFKSSTLDQINYTALLDLLSQPVVGTDLTAFAEGLDKAAQLQGNETVKEDLKKVANMTRNLSQLVELQELDAREMSTSVRSMREISQKYQGNADRALNSITETEEAILLQTPYIVRNVSQCVLKKGERYISEYLDWVRNAVINMVLDCKWLPVSVDNIYTAACLNIIDPLNAFWLCLGWCWALLIPGVILSIHTARHWWQAVPKSLSVTLKDLDSSPGMTKSYKSLK